MIDQGNRRVKHFPFQDMEVEIDLGLKVEPRYIDPAGDSDLLPVVKDVPAPGIYAPIPTHRKKIRVGVGIESGADPDVRKSPVIGVVSGRGVQTVLASRIKPHIAGDSGRSRNS